MGFFDAKSERQSVNEYLKRNDMYIEPVARATADFMGDEELVADLSTMWEHHEDTLKAFFNQMIVEREKAMFYSEEHSIDDMPFLKRDIVTIKQMQDGIKAISMEYERREEMRRNNIDPDEDEEPISQETEPTNTS